MCYPGMKGIFFPLHGGGAGYGLALGSHGAQQDEAASVEGGSAGAAGFKASKQPPQTEKKYFPRECAAQSCVVIHNM